MLDRLIVMDNVSGLTDRSETFANFLTISRKYGLTCIYIFHTIYPTRQNLQMILSQTKIFHIFPNSVQTSSIVGIFSYFYSRYKHTYIPETDLRINWINYFEILNSTRK